MVLLISLACSFLVSTCLNLQVSAQPAPGTTQAPIVYDTAHNMTPIVGTWASGSQQVVTGPGFAIPANTSFTYPKVGGISYSFTIDGFYEIARYRFNSNGSEPTCITAVINWVHGTYDLLDNGTMLLTPFGDGYQQIEDPCGAQSNFIENYNLTETYVWWQIFQDPTAGYKLHLWQFDGSPLAPMFQVSVTPQMLPTQMLRNVSAVFTEQDGLTVTGSKSVSTNGAERRVRHTSAKGVVGVVLGLGLTALML